ncbi:MAG: hypothetical protein PVJ63_05685 [Thioalkalispiraceae bacterium]
MKTTRLFRSCLLGIGLVTGLSACVYDPYYAGPGPRVYHPYYYPYYYDYYYYPGVRVYFQLSTGVYFYFWDNRWIRTKVLPPYIYLDPRNRVKVRVEGDKPYVKHHIHAQKYKPRFPPPPQPKARPPQLKPQPPAVKRPPSQLRPEPPAAKRPPPKARPQPPVAKPGTPLPRTQPPMSRQEREHNLRIYKEHQQKQQEFEKEWEKRNKKEGRR